jgi:hypothetical protein
LDALRQSNDAMRTADQQTQNTLVQNAGVDDPAAALARAKAASGEQERVRLNRLKQDMTSEQADDFVRNVRRNPLQADLNAPAGRGMQLADQNADEFNRAVNHLNAVLNRLADGLNAPAPPPPGGPVFEANLSLPAF